MDKVIDLPMEYLSNTEKGYVQSRISECSSIGSIFSPSVIGIFFSVIDSMLALVTMFAINYKLSIVILTLAPIFFLSSKASANEFMKSTLDMMESTAMLNGECFEIINGIEDIKVLNGKKSHLLRFKNKLEALIKYSTKQSKSMLLFMENIELVDNFGSVLVLLVAGILILKGQFTIGMYTSFSLYINKIFGATQNLATLGTAIKPVCLGIERVYELLDMEDENSSKNESIKGHIDAITFENVSFNYRNNTKNVLDSLSFKVCKGEKVLIKGENGAGKSTLIKLIMGLYTPTSGKLIFNDLDLILVNNKSIREKISIVSQNIFLFRGTVLDNILYGQTQKQREDVKKLIKELNFDDYINKLPKGLDSEISQNTNGLSGGQAQVIAFIRAMLSNRDVIILDEPIANVDVQARKLILNILKNRKFDGIILIVSHIMEGMEFISKIIEL
ncbi:ABC transporter ATP-binding protein [Clostridium oryzae]|uniref:Putative ABC transporter ATP-binding protein n=1 Tax=Clostridium oryzae TaxID=1450648 RepID=A0A1V4IBH3_9CLOT|nr:ABC transporter ATP-binding protein [Clostridium oryzae]OPJ57352.1 putative ABC transporter ATP-binding protein [Clostridium oryzae]